MQEESIREFIIGKKKHKKETSKFAQLFRSFLHKSKYIWRVSYVRMYYSKRIEKDTPSPFAEIRIFVFREKKPSNRFLRIFKRLAKEMCDELIESGFLWTIREAEDTIYYEDDLKEDGINAIYPKTPKVQYEINGYEIAKIDIDEVSKYLKGFKGKTITKLKFDEIYRYVCFYKTEEELRGEEEPYYRYNETDIKKEEERWA